MDIDAILNALLDIIIPTVIFCVFVLPFMVAVDNYCSKRGMSALPAFMYYMTFSVTGTFAYYLGLTGRGSTTTIVMVIIFTIIFLGSAINYAFQED